MASLQRLRSTRSGSQVNARYGLAAASEMLRDAGVAVTAAHYVENKQRSVFFGHLLKNGRTIIPINEQDGKADTVTHRVPAAR